MSFHGSEWEAKKRGEKRRSSKKSNFEPPPSHILPSPFPAPPPIFPLPPNPSPHSPFTHTSRASSLHHSRDRPKAPSLCCCPILRPFPAGGAGGGWWEEGWGKGGRPFGDSEGPDAGCWRGNRFPGHISGSRPSLPPPSPSCQLYHVSTSLPSPLYAYHSISASPCQPCPWRSYHPFIATPLSPLARPCGRITAPSISFGRRGGLYRVLVFHELCSQREHHEEVPQSLTNTFG